MKRIDLVLLVLSLAGASQAIHAVGGLSPDSGTEFIGTPDARFAQVCARTNDALAVIVDGTNVVDLINAARPANYPAVSSAALSAVQPTAAGYTQAVAAAELVLTKLDLDGGNISAAPLSITVTNSGYAAANTNYWLLSGTNAPALWGPEPQGGLFVSGFYVQPNNDETSEWWDVVQRFYTDGALIDTWYFYHTSHVQQRPQNPPKAASDWVDYGDNSPNPSLVYVSQTEAFRQAVGAASPADVDTKLDKTAVVQTMGTNTDQVVSQAATTALETKVVVLNNIRDSLLGTVTNSYISVHTSNDVIRMDFYNVTDGYAQYGAPGTNTVLFNFDHWEIKLGGEVVSSNANISAVTSQGCAIPPTYGWSPETVWVEFFPGQFATKLDTGSVTPTVTGGTNTVPSNAAVTDALADIWTRFVGSNADKLALTNLSAGAVVVVTNEANRVEMYAGGAATNDASWVIIKGSHLIHVGNATSSTLTFNGVECAGSNALTTVGWIREGEAWECSDLTGKEVSLSLIGTGDLIYRAASLGYSTPNQIFPYIYYEANTQFVCPATTRGEIRIDVSTP
jgi:hypothetical protein